MLASPLVKPRCTRLTVGGHSGPRPLTSAWRSHGHTFMESLEALGFRTTVIGLRKATRDPVHIGRRE